MSPRSWRAACFRRSASRAWRRSTATSRWYGAGTQAHCRPRSPPSSRPCAAALWRANETGDRLLRGEELVQHGRQGLRANVMGLTVERAVLSMGENGRERARAVLHPRRALPTSDGERRNPHVGPATRRQWRASLELPNHGPVVGKRVRNRRDLRPDRQPSHQSDAKRGEPDRLQNTLYATSATP